MASNTKRRSTLWLFLGWLRSSFLRLLFLLVLAGLTVLLLWLGRRFPVWPIFLATECAAVCFGIDLGWCIVKFDRSRLKNLKMTGDLDQLGFFNSRIAMRSPELFDIAIADVHGVSSDDKESARTLVRQYWEPKSRATTESKGESR